MKYIFLDIDGVLNSSRYKRCDKSPNGWLGLDDELIKIAQPLLCKDDIKIILSSTWRKLDDGDLEWLKKRLNDYNIKIFDKTTNEISEDRRDLQIIDYINKNIREDDSLVILDDSFLDVFIRSGLREFLVPIDWNYGITEEDIELAEGILRKKLSNKHFNIFQHNYNTEKRFGR